MVFSLKVGLFWRLPKGDNRTFDKTGTLTTGDMNVHSFHIDKTAAQKFNLDSVSWWKYVGCIEQSSEHPIARGTMKKVREVCGLDENLQVDGTVTDFVVKVGFGVSANVKIGPVTRAVNVGNIRMMDDEEVSGVPQSVRELEKHTQGETLIIMSIDGVYAGYIALPILFGKMLEKLFTHLRNLVFPLVWLAVIIPRLPEKWQKRLAFLLSWFGVVFHLRESLTLLINSSVWTWSLPEDSSILEVVVTRLSQWLVMVLTIRRL